MKKTILLLMIGASLASCLKKKTCTCKIGNTTAFTETSTDKNKVQQDCDKYEAQANGPGATVQTVCTVQ